MKFFDPPVSHLFGYTTASLNSLVSRNDLIKSFFQNDVENYFILGDYDILSVAPIKSELDLLSRKFSSFYLNKSNSSGPKENFEAFTNWVEKVFQTDGEVKDLPIIGLIRIKVHKQHLSSPKEELDKKITELISNSLNSNDFYRLYRSHAWDEYQLLINTTSFSNVFEVTRELNKIEYNDFSFVKKTETLLGMNFLFFKNRKHSDLSCLDNEDKVGLSIVGISPETFKIEKEISDELDKIIGFYRVAGKVDFFVYPRNDKRVYLLSTKELIQKLFQLFDFIQEKELIIKISSTVYEEFTNNDLKSKDFKNTNIDRIGFSHSYLEVFYDAMISLKIPTQERASITFLINNFNSYCDDSLMMEGMLELYDPIDEFIKEIVGYKDQKKFRPHIISRRIKTFTKALKQAIANRLHSSQRFEKTNDIFISTKCGFTKALSAYNSMCKYFALIFGVKGFFVHFDYDCHLKITDQSLNLNLFSIVKPELFCTLLGAEMFNLFLQQDNFQISSQKYFNKFSDFRTPKKALNNFVNAIQGEYIFNLSILFKYSGENPLKLVNQSFVDHVYMDIFNYMFIFTEEERKLYKFWYWASFLMDSKKYNQDKQIDNTNLKTRMLRFELVQRMIMTMKDERIYGVSYPTDFLELNDKFAEFRPMINDFTNRVVKNNVIKDWIDQVKSVFVSLKSRPEFQQEIFKGYRENKLILLTGIFELFDNEKMKFSYTGALELLDDTESDKLHKVNDLRKAYLKNIVSISESINVL